MVRLMMIAWASGPHLTKEYCFDGTRLVDIISLADSPIASNGSNRRFRHFGLPIQLKPESQILRRISALSACIPIALQKHLFGGSLSTRSTTQPSCQQIV